jgi:hypothetical protein
MSAAVLLEAILKADASYRTPPRYFYGSEEQPTVPPVDPKTFLISVFDQLDTFRYESPEVVLVVSAIHDQYNN